MGQQLYVTNSLGGYYSVPKLTNELRHAAQPMMRIRQFVSIENQMGKGQSNTLYFDKVSNISTAGGTIAETDTIPSNNYTIVQDSLVVTEYGNSVKFTEKLKHLSQISVTDDIKSVLTNDQAKVLDSAAAAEFVKAKTKAVSTATNSVVFTTDGTATATANGKWSDDNHRAVITRMKNKDNLVPTYDGNNYVLVGSTQLIASLYDFWEDKITQTVPDNARLISGIIGQYYQCLIVEENNYLSNTLGTGSVFGEGLYFGRDAVKEGVVVPEEIRIGIPQDVGRQQKMAWYYLGGFKKMWDLSTDSESRIVHVTSA